MNRRRFFLTARRLSRTIADMTTSSSAAPHRYPGRLFVFFGLVLPVLGIVGYVVQIMAHRLTTPWYLPGLATLGVVFLLFALLQARSVWRVLALLLVVLVAGAEWTFLVSARLPDYKGPVTAGRPFPDFVTAKADGKPFTQKDLEGDQDNVLVFFRGRW
jgi:hypothetical protein